MSRYITHRSDKPVSQPDPRPFRPMRRGGFSPLDLPFWAVAIGGAAWLPHHVNDLAELIGGLAGLGIAGGIAVSFVKLWLHRRQSKPMISPADQPFS